MHRRSLKQQQRALSLLSLFLVLVLFVLPSWSVTTERSTEVQMFASGSPATAVATTAPLGLPPAQAEPVVATRPLSIAAASLISPRPVVTTTSSGPSPSQPQPTATDAAVAPPPPATPVEPTAEPEPTLTSAPTATAEPTPTARPEPTATPAPTATAVPTLTPTPTSTPTATPTAKPEPARSSGASSAKTSVDGYEVTELGYVTLGNAGAVSIMVPAARIQLIGFHQASHPGAQAINAASTGLALMTLPTRSRGTHLHSAADIVVPPGEPLRSPITGTVVASSTYVLYCQYQDKLVYIEPDGMPGWQVRLFHVQGDTPAVGTRVIAGESVVAAGGARPLPFESQIDEFSKSAWPHVHLEVVDMNIPDTRPKGGGC